VSIYDCGKLETDDFKRMFAITPNLQNLTLENCGQLKDEVIDYILERDIPLRTMKLEAPNLVNDAKWREFFTKAGGRLETLKLTWLDYAMDDETVGYLVRGCPNLRYLKLKKCFRLGDDSLEILGQLQKLEHLSLESIEDADDMKLNKLVKSVGSNLRSLALQKFGNADDCTLEYIHDNCNKLRKLRFTENEICTDTAFAALFTKWINPPLLSVNLADNRDIDHRVPDGPEDPVGFASSGLKALMEHSGSKIERLILKSCRHISHGALLEVFDGIKQYPHLREIDLSFVPQLDTVAVAGLIKSCPTIQRITAFGCFDVKDVEVPVGVALIGLPNAHESTVHEGR